MKKILIGLALFSPWLNGHAQQSTMGTVAGKQLDVKSASGTVLTQLPMAPPKTNGDVYLDSEWTLADIHLTGQTAALKGYPVKLDLGTNSLEVQHQGQVKMLPGVRVNYFVLLRNDGKKEKYINGKNLLLGNEPIGGFLQVVDSGRWMLLVKKQLKMIEASYNQALDVGKKDNELVKDEKSFLSKDNALYQTDLPVKKFCKQFPGHETAISRFIKEERISLKKLTDLTKLLAFLDHNI